MNRYIDTLRRRMYSPSTIAQYMALVKSFVKIPKHISEEHLTDEDSRRYAAQILENGMYNCTLQELLDYKSLVTIDSKRSGEPRSAIYSHVRQQTKQKIPNPLDQLKL